MVTSQKFARKFDCRLPFSIGEWSVAPSEGLFTRGSRSIRVQPKVMSVLLCLIEYDGALVSKDALLDEVWEGRIVGDEAVQRCISQLRGVFGDNPKAPRFIETVPKRGYRLMQNWQPAPAHAPITAAPKCVTSPKSAGFAPRARRVTRSGPGLAAIGLALIGIVSGAYSLNWVSSHHKDGRAAGIVGVEQEVFARAMRFYDRRDMASNESAIGIFEQALKEDPHFVRGYYGLATAYVQKYSNWTRDPNDISTAFAAALKAVQLDDTDPGAHNALGLTRSYLGDYEGALQSYEVSLAIAPDQWRILGDMGRIYYKQENYEDAKTYFERALVYSPNNPYLFKKLGAANLRMNDLSEAEKWYSELLATHKMDDYANAKLAYVHMRRGDYAKAINQCEDTLSRTTDNKFCSLMYGKLLIAEEEYELAYVHLAKQKSADRKLARHFETYQLVAEIRTGRRPNAEQDILAFIAEIYSDDFLSENDQAEMQQALSQTIM